MPTSLNPFLSEILEGQRIPDGKLSYFRARLKNRFHEAVLTQFVEQKINKADLARRLGKKPEQITRWLGSPGNWTLDTLSDLLLGMGCEPALSVISLRPNQTVNLSPQSAETEHDERGESIIPEKTLAGSAMQFGGEMPMVRGRLGSMQTARANMGMPV